MSIRAVQIIVIVLLLAGIVIGIRQITIVTIPLILALIIACSFAPTMSWLRRRGLPSLVATTLILLTVLVLTASLGALVTWAVSDQWGELYTQAERGIQHLLTFLETLPLDFISTEQIDGWLGMLTDIVFSAQFGSGALASVGAVVNFLTGLVLMITILFFFLKDGPHMWEFLLRPFSGANYARARRIGDKTVSVLGSYVRGTATVALVDAGGILIGLLVLQVPLAVPLAVLVFLLAFIPIVGATFAGILAALVALVANGPINALAVVVVIIVVNQLEGNLLQPVLMGRSMKLHAFVILIALAVGAVLEGVVGAVLAVPIAAAIWGIVQVWDGPDLAARWARRKQTMSLHEEKRK